MPALPHRLREQARGVASEGGSCRATLCDVIQTPAGGRSGADWIGQKKNKSGKREAADQDRPVPDVEAKNSTLRHSGDEL
jgi:hypothetical protein